MAASLGGARPTSPVERIVAALSEAIRADIGAYKTSTLNRRIARRAALARHADLDDYATLVEQNPTERDLLIADLLLDVTEFFRDEEAWRSIEAEMARLAAEAAAAGRPLRLWSLACATGQEAYSLAMVAVEAIERLDDRVPVQIFATDIHEPSLARAGAARYEFSQVAGVSSERRRRFFNETASGVQVRPEVRSLVTFANHNALEDAPFLRIDLLCCRNVLISLEPAAQERVLDLAFGGVRIGGVIALGPSESLGELEPDTDPIDPTWRVVRKARGHDRAARSTGSSLAAPRPRSSARVLSRGYDAFHALRGASGFLVDDAGAVVHSFGRGGRLLAADVEPTGQPLTSMLTNGALRTAIDLVITGLRAAESGLVEEAVELPGALFDDEIEGPITAIITGSSFTADGEHFAVVRLDPVADDPPATVGDAGPAGESLTQLHGQLTAANARLAAMSRRHADTDHQLTAASEAFAAARDELQAKNEELQSYNEELIAVNNDHHRRLEQVLNLSADLEQMLDTVDLSAVLLNSDGTIRRASASARAIFGVRDVDVGRPFADLATTLDREQLLVDIRDVARGGDPVSRRIEVGDPPAPRTLLVDRYDLPHGETGAFLAVLPVEEMGPAEREYRALLEQSPVAMYAKDADGVYTALNRYARDVTDASVGLSDAEFLPAHIAEGVRVNDRAVAASGEPEFTVETYGMADGSQTRMLSMKFPMGDGGVGGLSVPITQNLAEVTSTLGPFFDIVEHLPVGLLTVDADDRVVAINSYLQSVSGLAPGMRSTDGYPPELHDAILDTHRAARAASQPFLEMRTNPTPNAGDLDRLAFVFPMGDGYVGQLIIPVTEELREIGGQLGPDGGATLDVFRRLPVGIVSTGDTGTVTAINDHFRSATGLDIGEAFIGGLAPDDAAVIAEVDAEVERTGGLVTRLLLSPGGDAANAPQLVLAFPIREHGVGRLFIEVDEQLQGLVGDLGPGTPAFRRVFDQMPISMIAKDADGVFTVVNEFGKTFGQAELGKTDYELHGAAVASPLEDHDDIVRRTGEPHYFLEELPTPDGLHRCMTVCFPMPGGGIGAVSIPLEETLREVFIDSRRVDDIARLAHTLGGLGADGTWRPLDSGDVSTARQRAAHIVAEIPPERRASIGETIRQLLPGEVKSELVPEVGIRLIHTRTPEDPEFDVISMSIDESDLLTEIERLRGLLDEAGIDPDV